MYILEIHLHQTLFKTESDQGHANSILCLILVQTSKKGSQVSIRKYYLMHLHECLPSWHQGKKIIFQESFIIMVEEIEKQN